MESQGIKVNLNKLYPFVYSLGLKFIDFVQSYDDLTLSDGLAFIKHELKKSNNVFSISNELELDEVSQQLYHFYIDSNDLNNPLAYVINDLSNLN